MQCNTANTANVHDKFQQRSVHEDKPTQAHFSASHTMDSPRFVAFRYSNRDVLPRYITEKLLDEVEVKVDEDGLASPRAVALALYKALPPNIQDDLREKYILTLVYNGKPLVTIDATPKVEFRNGRSQIVVYVQSKAALAEAAKRKRESEGAAANEGRPAKVTHINFGPGVRSTAELHGSSAMPVLLQPQYPNGGKVPGVSLVIPPGTTTANGSQISVKTVNGPSRITIKGKEYINTTEEK